MITVEYLGGSLKKPKIYYVLLEQALRLKPSLKFYQIYNFSHISTIMYAIITTCLGWGRFSLLNIKQAANTQRRITRRKKCKQVLFKVQTASLRNGKILILWDIGDKLFLWIFLEKSSIFNIFKRNNNWWKS